MNWWLLIPAVPAYLAVGLAIARWSFVGDLGDSPRLQVDDCTPRFCVHDITMVNGKRHRPTKKYEDARSTARFLTVGWPLLILLYVVVAPFGLMAGVFDRVINRPTKAEKLTQRQRDLAALSTKAKELGLPVPDEWIQEGSHLEPGDQIRNKFRNKYGEPIILEQ